MKCFRGVAYFGPLKGIASLVLTIPCSENSSLVVNDIACKFNIHQKRLAVSHVESFNASVPDCLKSAVVSLAGDSSDFYYYGPDITTLGNQMNTAWKANGSAGIGSSVVSQFTVLQPPNFSSKLSSFFL